MHKQERRITLVLVLIFLISFGSLCFAAAEESSSDPAPADPTSAVSPAEGSDEPEPAPSSQDEPTVSADSSSDVSSEGETSDEPQSSSSSVSSTASTGNGAATTSQPPTQTPAPGTTGGNTTLPADDPDDDVSLVSDDGKEDFTLTEQPEQPGKKNILDLAGRIRLWILLPVTLAAASIAALVYVNRKRFLSPTGAKKSR